MGSDTQLSRYRALIGLKASRLRDLAASVGAEPSDRRSVDALASALVPHFVPLLELLKREELQLFCDTLGLDRSGREKAKLIGRLVEAVGESLGEPTPRAASAPEVRPSRSAAPRTAPVQAALDLGVEPAATKARTPRAAKPTPARAEPGPLASLHAPPSPLASQAAAPTTAPLDDEPAPTSLRFDRGARPDARGVLSTLPKRRLDDLARDAGVVLPEQGTRAERVAHLLEHAHFAFDRLLGELSRDELRAACRAHHLSDDGRSRTVLASRLLDAHGVVGSRPPPPIFRAHEAPRYAPRPGDIVELRHRQWLAEEVIPPPEPGHATRVRLACLDDDAQGREVEVLWELELGARVRQPEAHGLGEVKELDPPDVFGAYLHTLAWHGVTATDRKLFQAPFRAGIHLYDHQVTPLKRALASPRVSLFVADDVGLGKTIEAGLVLEELLLRQRVHFVLVVCPAGVALQWRDELTRKFGLHFEIMNRAFVTRRRQERGFGVNPWSTHTRFVVSYQLLRRPEVRDALLAHVGERATKSLLVLDEAHLAAPASSSRYAVDSQITSVVRDLGPKFEHRLFLSATPHNGHSNSFSALLELLDPRRFTRGIPVRPDKLDAVMVRRLKRDLRRLGSTHYPSRIVRRIDVPASSEPASIEPVAPLPELELATELAEYSSLLRPAKGRGRLVFINLQKRLLSSVEAFARTLRVHARAVGTLDDAALVGEQPNEQLALPGSTQDDDEYGVDDAMLDAEDEALVAEASTALARPSAHPAARARELLASMLARSAAARSQPCAKLRALLAWIREHQCAGVAFGGGEPGARWTGRRVIVFTEYGDTKRYLVELLSSAVAGTDEGEARILTLHGGMGDEQREEVQRAFNSPPGDHPVRILVATDAAREGINLQGHCADLFHFDIPWNPARIEQRNGRIDRAMQPEPEVRCHYFHYPSRREDAVLDTLVRKVETIQAELGSLSAVLMEGMEKALEPGIDDEAPARLAAAEQASGRAEVARRELEERRLDRIELDDEENATLLQRSRERIAFEPAQLRHAVDVGLALAGAPTLAPVPGAPGRYTLPELPASWASTLDSLREPQRRDEAVWEWRKRPLMPVVFEAPERMNAQVAQLFLEHPVVKRLLGRFLAQGTSQHDLSRVTVLHNPHDHIVRVVAFGRLSLFGHGATRLHDELVSVAAQWSEASGELSAFGDRAEQLTLDRFERLLEASPSLDAVGPATRQRIAEGAPELFATLWPLVREEADALSKRAEIDLAQRGSDEARELSALLDAQLAAIDAELATRRASQAQPGLFDGWDARESRQWELDTEHMASRRVSLAAERAREPEELSAFYRVARRRLEPVGLVVLWPATKG